MNRKRPASNALRLALTACVALCAVASVHAAPHADDAGAAHARLAALGRALYFDVNLSARRSLACASCHDPARGFIDARADGPVSRGDDGHSLGTRNTPSIAYAALVPPFGRAADGAYRGGLFLDGRADTLEQQAAVPLLDPREMALPHEGAVVARVRENAAHVTALEAIFGAGVLAETARGMAAITQAIAAFERRPPFKAFDSRYDRYLRGAATLTAQEERGRRLYFSDLTNCMQCHLLHTAAVERHEPFTDHRYHNIGVPANPALAHTAPDTGLARRGGVDATAAGRFRTPSLRNVAVTAPYMHNGVFRRLATAIQFYNRYLVDNEAARRNPETGAPWGPPEVDANLAHERLRQGQPLDATRVAELVAFLRTLTDRRFEHLLPAEAAPATATGTVEKEPSHE